MLRINLSNQITNQVLPKTGTKVTQIYDAAGQLMSKTVVLGEKNRVSKYIKSFQTMYTHGRPITMITEGARFEDPILEKGFSHYSDDVFLYDYGYKGWINTDSRSFNDRAKYDQWLSMSSSPAKEYFSRINKLFKNSN